MRLFRRDVGFFDQFAVAREVGFDDIQKIIWRAADNLVAAFVHQAIDHVGSLQRPVRRLIQLVYD
jgi:hypothetical protein